MAEEIQAARQELEAAIGGKTLCDVFAATVEKHGDVPALKWKTAEGWQTLTWAGYREKVTHATLGLQTLGFERGDFGLIMTRNRPEHVIADLAFIHSPGTSVSIYNTLAPEQIAYIANHCEAKVAIVEDPAFLERFLAVRGELPHLQKIVVLERAAEGPADLVISWDELLERGSAQHRRDPESFERAWRPARPDDVATLIYTSGTTGPPKGVMDTHHAILWDVETVYTVWSRPPAGERRLSYLPLAHAAERAISHWPSLMFGITTHFVPDPAQLVPSMLEVRPEYFVGVPRVWEKLYAGINAGLSAEPDAGKRALVQAAIAAGREATDLAARGVAPSAELAAQLQSVEPVLAAIRAKVGLDQSGRQVSGAAPISMEVLEFFSAIGLPINEVWGMSELVAVGTMNPPEKMKLGTVGRACPGVEIRLADDGELLLRGANVMPAYYRDEERTREALDPDGWLRTGDIATVDDEGYYRIVDRKKELIITAGGKNISPANLENLLKQHPLVGQAAAIGDQRSHITALVVLDGEVAPAWAQQRGIAFTNLGDLAENAEVVELISQAVAAANEHVARVEQVKRFVILPVEWTAESEELTPTLKLKRRVINQRYAKVIEALYAESPIGHEAPARVTQPVA
jgi:long-chain acyl-CoA synthetase